MHIFSRHVFDKNVYKIFACIKLFMEEVHMNIRGKPVTKKSQPSKIWGESKHYKIKQNFLKKSRDRLKFAFIAEDWD